MAARPDRRDLDADVAGGGHCRCLAFYERAGFGVRIYADDQGDGGDGFAFVDYDGQSVFDLDAAADVDPSANRAGCYLIANDGDVWHARMTAVGLPVTPIADQPWGMREFTSPTPVATTFASAA